MRIEEGLTLLAKFQRAQLRAAAQVENVVNHLAMEIQ